MSDSIAADAISEALDALYNNNNNNNNNNKRVNQADVIEILIDAEMKQAKENPAEYYKIADVLQEVRDRVLKL